MAKIVIDEQIARAEISKLKGYADAVAGNNDLSSSGLGKMPGAKEIVKVGSELYSKVMLPLVALIQRDCKYLDELIEGFEETDQKASQ